MTRNWSSSADRLENLARAAGFAMATPDDRPEESQVAPRTAPRPVWTSAKPPSTSLVVHRQRRPDTYQAMFRDWVASLGWRAPA